MALASGRNVISSATFLLTVRCTSSCSYCDFPRNQIQRELETDEVIALLSALRRQGLFRLGLSGGEPLLREDFGVIAREVRCLGLLSSLTTNGLLLADRAGDAMDMDYVLCSIDGLPETHDAVRGKGSHRAALAGLAELRSRGHRKLGLITAVHQGNAHTLDEVVRFAENLGAWAFFQPTQRRLGWIGTPFDGYCTPEQLHHVFSQLKRWKLQGRAVGNSFAHLELVRAGDTSEMGRRCHAGRFFFTILPDGTLMPCCLWAWDQGVQPMDARTVAAALAALRRPPCTGCTIVSYLENTRLMTGHPEAVLNALGWSGRLPGRRREKGG